MSNKSRLFVRLGEEGFDAYLMALRQMKKHDKKKDKDSSNVPKIKIVAHGAGKDKVFKIFKIKKIT